MKNRAPSGSYVDGFFIKLYFLSALLLTCIFLLRCLSFHHSAE